MVQQEERMAAGADREAPGATGTALPPDVRRLVDLLARQDGPLDRAGIKMLVQRRFRMRPRVLSELLQRAFAAGALVESGGRILVGHSAEPQEPAEPAAPGAGLLRAVVVDVESMVRPIAAEPYTETCIYQIGARRIGTDDAWAAQGDSFSRYVELPNATWKFTSAEVAKRHAENRLPEGDVLEEFAGFCEGADSLVAYNGTESDFVLLENAFRRADVKPPEYTLVDAYYLALALWPNARTHRLGPLATDLGVSHSDLRWHDASDDCALLARVLMHAADTVAGWPDDLRGLVASACADSPAWSLVGRLAARSRGGGTAAPRGHGHAEVAATLSRLLADHRPRRAGVRTGAAFEVGPELRDASGRVDAHALATLSHGRGAARRPAQDEMTIALHGWADCGTSALIEAPTGTGKSYAVLSASLDWLSGSSKRTSIIATYTKQLQGQLADDVVRFEDTVPGLVASTDVVKGQANRLSLRGLVSALAEATAVGRPGGGQGHQVRSRFLAKKRYRELLVFLLLRLVSSPQAPASWTARSVDPVDLPTFFVAYGDGAVPGWLRSLSQAANGDYAAGANTTLAVHTDTVAEALSSHRLVIANHALLLAHLAHVRTAGADLMLILDEAHQLEDAATSALASDVEYAAVEDVHSELVVWSRSVAGADGGRVRAAVDALSVFLDHEQLPRVVSRAFDSRGTGAGVLLGSRAVTLASAYAGQAGVAAARQVSSLLRRLRKLLGNVVSTVRSYLDVDEPGLAFFEAERIKALLTRATDLTEKLNEVCADLDDLLFVEVTAATEAGKAADEHLPVDDVLEADDVVDDDFDDETLRAGAGELGPLPPGTSNRLVYAEELAQLQGELRHYRFKIATSPIELPAEPAWRQFTSACARTFYLSATLTVAGDWSFLRSRLGLPATLPTLELSTPFDLRRQVELVCFSDFPSWSEQGDAAMRTVAHQLAGYSREMIRPAAGDPHRGGFDGGGLVLTTARSTAGGIAEHLASNLRRSALETPVHSSLVLGNARSVEKFTDPAAGGGFLVGTKGLWQGVDIADEERLRLVWINKLPFAPFGAPLVEARHAAVAARAESRRLEDPEAVATERYYLPLAALQVRQAVGRLIRSERHRGVVVISDRKLAGATAIRRAYRRTFLGSLGDELLRDDPRTGERGGGNVTTMANGWSRIWRFFADHGLLTAERADELCTEAELSLHTVLPYTLRIRDLAMKPEEVTQHRNAGTLEAEVLSRAEMIGGLLKLSEEPAELRRAQRQVIGAVAAERNVLALLPTGAGKSFCFQLPALVLPGVTIVVSPLVALMHDQALALNRTIGGAVRALVAPLRESSSRTGKTEVAEQLEGRADHGIRMVYVSPERLCQRRFRELVRSAVENGIVRRVAIDEAHTVVQWDDFRPAMTRALGLLAELRTEYGLPITALTATANRAVHAELRTSVFGLGSDAADESAEAATGALVTVRDNPIRPELAIFRRRIDRAQPAWPALLAEEVVDRLDGHAIFYCLTVREVTGMHAHLRDYLGEAGGRVLRFHGRLTEAEKASVMTQFSEAPRKGQEGFAPLVIVATSAFGLGVDRDDVRTVFCTSAPTDIAALYQQIGRAGRDAAGRPSKPAVSGEEPVAANVGLALLTSRGLRTARFMAGADLPPPLLRRMAAAVLRSSGVVDAALLADSFLAEDVAAGRLSEADARRRHTGESYRAGVLRALNALVTLGAVEDLGDFPPYCAVKVGELVFTPTVPADTDALEVAVVKAVLALPARRSGVDSLWRGKLSVIGLDAMLASHVAGYRQLAEDAAATWQLLSDFHDRGLLDVSAAPSRRLVTGIRVIGLSSVPGGFEAVVSGGRERALEEVQLLHSFFEQDTVCANELLADYFGAEVPADCCTHAGNRCSACWKLAEIPLTETEPRTGEALNSDPWKRRDGAADVAYRRRRLEEQVFRMLTAAPQGVHPRNIHRALRGENTFFNPRTRTQVRLPAALTSSRHFGVDPLVTLTQVEAALARLAEIGRVVQDQGRWRPVNPVRDEGIPV
ncbi:DEAD/DEAH box helicase [Amycolatopsis sp. 3B14]|uniref:DEAD/DEAH box helicase n=1 Tax=Amycolatopsis sp. 3B14 TaxID=3243600 RepID=UPI003D95C43C